ncbi:MAG: 50S ribosomal protein L22 [Proteobacteria bacterium]|nr:50S ribosomal protein L22 [Cystobacterineae bacterium]MCL2258606.1 50S ribosomal protein L22 [Cystobacterineae bacterium]MCL2315034.1 50S ribosomal protein L22 [Pseudomonadota bacterium]
MESTAHLRYLRMSPRKVADVASLVRGKRVGTAMDVLRFTKRAAALPLRKLIESAIANATDRSRGAVDVDKLVVTHISVDSGPIYKRVMFRARGQGYRIHKKTSHVHVVLTEANSKGKQ